MAYATRKDIELAAGGADRLVQLADWDHDGVADDDAIDAAQVEAEGLIDSYAARRYAVPLQRPSAYLIRLAAKETVYQLRVARQTVTEEDAEQHEQRIAWLKDLSVGKVLPSDPLPPRSSAVKDRYSDSRRAVSRERTKGYW